jgi:hypothetical protein
MKFLTKTSSALCLALCVSLIQVPQAVALKQGDECLVLNSTKKLGKNQFKCLGSEKIKFWIQVPASTIPQSAIKTTVRQWNTYIESISLTPYTSETESASIDDNLTKLRNLRNAVTEKIRVAEEIATNYKSSHTRLTANATAYSDALAAKKTLRDKSLADYQSAQSRVTTLSSQYQSALSSRSARIACQVLADFGFGSPCRSDSYQDAVDVQAIRNYDSAKAASDAAYTSYKAAYDDYFATMDLVGAEKENAQLALDTSEIYSARISEWKTLIGRIAEQESYSLGIVNDQVEGLGVYIEILERLPKTSRLIDLLGRSSKSNLKSRYQNAYLDFQFLKIATDSYGVRLERKAEYLPTEINSEEVQIWSPTKYFKTSNNKEIQNTTGINLAWSWSNRSACKVSSPCTRAFVVLSKDCSRGVIGLDFMTDAKVSEAKTFSKEYSFKAGEISIVEIETKYTTTAPSAYLRSFQCNA